MNFLGLLFWFLSDEELAKFCTVYVASISSVIGLITFLTRLGDRRSR